MERDTSEQRLQEARRYLTEGAIVVQIAVVRDLLAMLDERDALIAELQSRLEAAQRGQLYLRPRPGRHVPHSEGLKR